MAVILVLCRCSRTSGISAVNVRIQRPRNRNVVAARRVAELRASAPCIMDAAHISIRICGRIAIGVLIDQNLSDACPRSRIACQHLFRLVEGDAALYKVGEIHRAIASDEGACSARAVRPVDRIPIETTVLPRARQIKRLSRRIDPGKIKVQRLKTADEACRIAALRVQRIARAAGK